MTPPSTHSGESADVVVVGGGTVGGWCASFLARDGAGRVTVVETSKLGHGASSRAAGMVRAQGGTPTAVELGMWSIAFYSRQREELGIDSGFVEQGYFMPAFHETEVAIGRERVAMQRTVGLEVEWIGRHEAEELNPTLARDCCLGGSYAPGDGYIDPPRNVLAYSHALAASGVEVREETRFLGLRTSSRGVCGVETSNGPISCDRVVLTGGPELAMVGDLADVRIPSGGVRHQVAVTQPCPQLNADALPMVFDVGAGIYWRPEDGGLLFGMSDPDEAPGPGDTVAWEYLERTRSRLAELVPRTRDLGLRKVWAATIDFTADHLPIFGPAGTDGVTLACAGGHGMMWGPAVARIAADLCLRGTTDVTDVSDLGLDRFDTEGRSRLAPDPIALPFPETIGG